MDDDDEDATSVSDHEEQDEEEEEEEAEDQVEEEEEEHSLRPPPRRAFVDGKAVRRLYRELGRGDLFSDPTTARSNGGGGGGGSSGTPSRSEVAYWAGPARALKLVRVASLVGQRKLRKYIILGEKPTFPHHLVTIRRPPENDLLPSYAVEEGDDDAEADDEPAPGSITYWVLDVPAGTITPSHSVDHHQSAPRLSDYHIGSACTAWDISRDLPAQLLVWEYSAEDLSSRSGTATYQKLEFRYGAQSILVDHLCGGSSSTRDPQVCFAGLPGDHQGVAVRALFPKTLYFYEPFGGAPIPAAATTAAAGPSWTTAPETPPPPLPPLPGLQLHCPRVTVVSLADIAARHLRAVLKGGTPEFLRCHSAFLGVRRPVRPGPGERQRGARVCTVAFGAAERRSRMYHLFVLELDPAARAHRVRAAKAFGGGAVFAWEGMGAWLDEELFWRAVERLLGRGGGGGGGDHVCGGECEEWGDGAVRVLCRFCRAPGPVKVVRMVESGVALAGWGVFGRS